MSRSGFIWRALCIAAVVSPTAFGQPKPVVPATMPAVVSVEAYGPGDPLAPTTQIADTLKPKLVTLNLKNTPVLTALAELAKVSGYTIKPGYDQWFRGKGTNITISATNQPFWVVMRDICTRGNVNLYNSGGDSTRAVQVIPSNYGSSGGQMKASVSIKGPFLTSVSSIQRENTVSMSSPDQTTRNIHVQLLTFIEPKIVGSEISYQPIIDEAVDDNGNSMMPEQRQPGENWQSERGIAWWGNFTLPYPKTNPGTRIAKLKGHIPAKLLTASLNVEISDPLKATNVDKTVGERRITFNSLKVSDQNANQYTLELTVYRDANTSPQDMNRLWRENIGLHLTDAQGKEATFYQSGGRGTGDSITRRFTFNKMTAPPTKLVIDVPTGADQINIPFELVNLPLP